MFLEGSLWHRALSSMTRIAIVLSLPCAASTRRKKHRVAAGRRRLLLAAIAALVWLPLQRMVWSLFIGEREAVL